MTPKTAKSISFFRRIARFIFELRDALVQAARSIFAHKLRAALTIAGVSVGIMAVIVIFMVQAGMESSFAKQLNSRWNRKGHGRVFAERYFALALTSYRQMWRTVRYVLNNGRKHGTWTKKDEPDPFSSGPWFFRWNIEPRRPSRRPPVKPPRYYDWLACIGVNDVPGPRWQEALACSTSFA